MARGSRADVVVANLVRSWRKQPQRFRHGSFRLPPRAAQAIAKPSRAPAARAAGGATSAVRRRGFAAPRP